MLSAKKTRAISLVVFTLLFLIVRFPRLGTDVINPDAVNWHFRSEQFVVGLKTLQFEKTYQHYHPGVTQMWITGPVVEITKHVINDFVYDKDNFILFHTLAKYANIFVQYVLSLWLVSLLTRIFKFHKYASAYLTSILVVSLFSMEPFFVGNSRLIHLDVLLTLFLFIGLSYAYLGFQKLKKLDILLAGIFLALAFLTKSIAIGGLLFALVFGSAFAFFRHGKAGIIKYKILLVFSFVLTLFLVFPAMLNDPIGVISDIFLEGERVGVRNGHSQIFFGNETTDPGLLFYPVVFLLKVSPITLLGVFVLLVYMFKSIDLSQMKRLFHSQNFLKNCMSKRSCYLIYLLVFYIGYVLVMTFPTKKLDRYILPVFPFFALVAVHGYYLTLNLIDNFASKIFVSILVVVSLFLPLATFFPWYFTYTSPIFGKTSHANEIIGQKPFGVGIFDLREFLFEHYDNDFPPLGFIDTKPMRTIYKNSNIFDIRESGTRKYDILVLAVNEEIPEKVLDSDNKFVYDRSFYINGLEYWKVYVKEGSRFYKN